MDIQEAMDYLLNKDKNKQNTKDLERDIESAISYFETEISKIHTAFRKCVGNMNKSFDSKPKTPA